MKSAALAGFWFILAIASIMAATLLSGIAWRLVKKPRKKFLERARGNFQKRFPHLYAGAYRPIVTVQSQCCRANLWTASNGGKYYFCDKCENECDRRGRRKDGGLNLSVMNGELSGIAQSKVGC